MTKPLLGRIDEERFWYAGDSVGGAVGLQLALDAPKRMRGLVAICTGARIGTTEMWAERANLVRTSGTPALLTASAQRWFGPGFVGAGARSSVGAAARAERR